MTVRGSRLLNHIVVGPRVMAGKAVVKGTGLTVQYILGLLASGASEDGIPGE